MTLLEPPSESMEVTGEIEQEEEIEDEVEEEMEEEAAEEEGIRHLVCVSPATLFCLTHCIITLLSISILLIQVDVFRSIAFQGTVLQVSVSIHTPGLTPRSVFTRFFTVFGNSF